jgi:glycopeptide antibiotics resistance protein
MSRTALVIEISQLSERIPGTFDVKDLFFMGMGALAEGLLYKFFVKRRSE